MTHSQAYKKQNKFFNQRGFSMLELMVVVTLIAILGFLAIPQYRLYQARARRTEGWNLMSAYYTASIASKAEYGAFPGNFVQVDFRPKGQLGYRITVQDGPDAPIALNDNGCVVTTAACACAGGCAGFKTWVDTGLGTQGYTLFGPQPPGAVACPTIANLGTTATTFSIRGSGRILPAPKLVDVLGMDERKTQEVCRDGIL